MARVPAPDLDALDQHGWLAVPGVLPARDALALADRCTALLDDVSEPGPGDKPAGGTRRAARLLERVPQIARLLEHPSLATVVVHLLGRAVPPTDVALRCPQPGFGGQSLHADDVPITHPGECRAVTAIVALCEFTSTNGATAVVPGSHRRPDLQRRVARLDLSASEAVLTGPPGTAFVFSAHLLHRGTLNRSDRPRPALQAQWRTAPAPGALWGQ